MLLLMLHCLSSLRSMLSVLRYTLFLSFALLTCLLRYVPVLCSVVHTPTVLVIPGRLMLTSLARCILSLCFLGTAVALKMLGRLPSARDAWLQCEIVGLCLLVMYFTAMAC